MSEQLDAAIAKIVELRGLQRAGRAGEIVGVNEVVDPLLDAVNHLAGAVQLLERKADRE